MIERMPSPAPKRSLKSLEAGLALFPHFRRHISVSGPVTAAQIAAICEATGLKERQIRTLAARYRAHPVADAVAPQSAEFGTGEGVAVGAWVWLAVDAFGEVLQDAAGLTAVQFAQVAGEAIGVDDPPSGSLGVAHKS